MEFVSFGFVLTIKLYHNDFTFSILAWASQFSIRSFILKMAAWVKASRAAIFFIRVVGCCYLFSRLQFLPLQKEENQHYASLSNLRVIRALEGLQCRFLFLFFWFFFAVLPVKFQGSVSALTPSLFRVSASSRNSSSSSIIYCVFLTIFFQCSYGLILR